jgi:hypothetical protein
MRPYVQKKKRETNLINNPHNRDVEWRLREVKCLPEVTQQSYPRARFHCLPEL